MYRKYDDSKLGALVSVLVDGKLVPGKIAKICTMSDQNPGADLVDVLLDGYGHEILDANDLIEKYSEPVIDPKPLTRHIGEIHFDDIESGFGIGGTGSDDYNINTDRDVYRRSGERCSWGGTRYDEECAGCGRVTAICNDCELCERCHKDGLP